MRQRRAVAIAALFLLLGWIACSDGERTVAPEHEQQTTFEWEQVESGTAFHLHGVARSHDKYVAVGGRVLDSRTVDGGIALSSSDGVSWDSVAFFDGVYMNDVIWSGSRFVAVGFTDSLGCFPPIRLSSDGVNWTTPAVVRGEISSLASIVYSGSKYVAVGGSLIVSSMDGEHWVEEVSGSSYQNLRGVIWTGSEFIAVGSEEVACRLPRHHHALVATCSDGMDWSFCMLDSVGRLTELKDIVRFGEKIVTVGPRSYYAEGKTLVLSTSDGLDWSMLYLDAQLGAAALHVSAGTIFAVGFRGAILTSQDAMNWTLQESGVSEHLNDVASSETQVVVVGNNGTILTAGLR